MCVLKELNERQSRVEKRTLEQVLFIPTYWTESGYRVSSFAVQVAGGCGLESVFCQSCSLLLLHIGKASPSYSALCEGKGKVEV